MPKGKKIGCMGCGCSLPLFVGIIVLLIFGFLAGPIGQRLAPSLHFPSWMSVKSPEIALPAETVFHVGSFPISNSFITAWITIIVLVVLSWVITRNLKLVPGRLQSAMETVLSYIYDFCTEVAGEKDGRRFFPLVCTIFLFVITNAWLAQIPFWGPITVNTPEGPVPLLRGANTDMNLPLALALVSFAMVGYFGFKAHRMRFLGQFFSFGRLFRGFGDIFRGRVKKGLGGLLFGLIDVVVGLLELLSQFIRILSFTFRLFGNMTAGEILILMITFLVPWIAAIPFYGLELLVGYIQALIFAGLTLVFLTVAVAHHEAE